MVSVLVGNRDINEVNILCQKLTNEKNFIIQKVASGNDIIKMYWKICPDILVIDNNLLDMSVDDIISRLSCNPLEQKKCNTILTLPENFNIKFKDVSKINKIIYKPIKDNQLVNTIKQMAIDYNTPDLDVGEVDWLLQSLNFNCMSPGYKFMRDAIIYCYYRPDQLEFLNTVLKYLAYKYNVPVSRARDSLKSSIRPFNNSNSLNIPPELQSALYNNGNGLSLKDFLERIVLYLIRTKKKGRIF